MTRVAEKREGAAAVGEVEDAGISVGIVRFHVS
jgi:hypothetical protein